MDNYLSQKPSSDSPFPAKFSTLVELGTNGINADQDTEDVVKKLMDWDERYGIEMSEISHDGLCVKFAGLPAQGPALDLLCQEIYDFCPDVIDQGFGCMGEMIAMMEEQGIAIDPTTQTLIAGIDFKDENSGFTLLARSLLADQTLALWWD
jgi:hypothetical protein